MYTVFMYIPVYTGIYWYIPVLYYTCIYLYIPVYTGIYLYRPVLCIPVHVYTGIYMYRYMCIYIYWPIGHFNFVSMLSLLEVGSSFSISDPATLAC